mmetsp:Transcript_91973/g.134418  ORF Transcript_91973/g.134418 Transcript_91973/m.134418 type:complete len:395 (+) Transcript_91973:11-1195(+)
MAPNNALGKATAAKMRERVEGRSPGRGAAGARGRSPGRKDRAETSSDEVRVSDADGFGAAPGGQSSVLNRDEVTSRGTGSAVRTPVDEFVARPRDELRCFWTGIMFLTRLPCPGWCDHHPGYLMRAMGYFPLLGALIGVWAAAFYEAAECMWSPLIAAALSSASTLWLTGCFHEDGLCDTLDGFGGGWTKSQIMRIMRDSRNGSYATMGAGLWILAKSAAIARLGDTVGPRGSTWVLGGSVGAGPAIIVAQAVARASSAYLIYFHEYIVDDEDAKGEYYNWFGDSRRLLGIYRVLFSILSSALVAVVVLPLQGAVRVLLTTAICTVISGKYGVSVLGGVMGDFLGATICIIELAIYLALGADLNQADGSKLLHLVMVVSLPQIYGVWRRWYERQ